MIINLQNRSPYAKTLADQSSGQLPLYLGPSRFGQHSSADITAVQFLAYFELIKRYTTSKRPLDGGAALLLITDANVAEITADQLLQGMVDGHLGTEAQKLAADFVQRRDEAETKAQAWEAEQRALRTGAALRG